MFDDVIKHFDAIGIKLFNFRLVLGLYIVPEDPDFKIGLLVRSGFLNKL